MILVLMFTCTEMIPLAKHDFENEPVFIKTKSGHKVCWVFQRSHSFTHFFLPFSPLVLTGRVSV